MRKISIVIPAIELANTISWAQDEIVYIVNIPLNRVDNQGMDSR